MIQMIAFNLIDVEYRILLQDEELVFDFFAVPVGLRFGDPFEEHYLRSPLASFNVSGAFHDVPFESLPLFEGRPMLRLKAVFRRSDHAQERVHPGVMFAANDIGCPA